MSARPGLCGGHRATSVPTAIAMYQRGPPTLSNGEGQRCTFTTAGAPEVTRIACGGLYLNIVGPGARNHRRCNGDRELGTVVHRCGDRAAIEDPNRGGNKPTACQDDRKAGWHLRKHDRLRRDRTEDGHRAGASAERIQSVTPGQEQEQDNRTSKAMYTAHTLV